MTAPQAQAAASPSQGLEQSRGSPSSQLPKHCTVTCCFCPSLVSVRVISSTQPSNRRGAGRPRTLGDTLSFIPKVDAEKRWVIFDRKNPGKRGSYVSSHMASMFSSPASQEQIFLTALPRRPSLPSGLAEPPLTLQPAQSLFLPRLPAPCPWAVGLFFLWTSLCPHPWATASSPPTPPPPRR